MMLAIVIIAVLKSFTLTLDFTCKCHTQRAFISLARYFIEVNAAEPKLYSPRYFGRN